MPLTEKVVNLKDGVKQICPGDEMANIADLKSAVERLAGSSPAPGTNKEIDMTTLIVFAALTVVALIRIFR